MPTSHDPNKTLQDMDGPNEKPTEEDSPVKFETLLKAAQGLSKVLEIKKETVRSPKSNLFEEDPSVFLNFVWRKVPLKSYVRPRKIKIPHTLWSEEKEFCVFVMDPRRIVKDKFQKENIKGKVLDLEKLRKNYKKFEDKRKLCASYDRFLFDARIMKSLPKLIGKTFFVSKKQPVQADIDRPILAPNIRKALDSTYLHISSGSCSMVEIAKISWDATKIAQNALSAIKEVIRHLPEDFQGWNGIQSIYLKTADSIALPLYSKLPPPPPDNLDQNSSQNVEKEPSPSKKRSRSSKKELKARKKLRLEQERSAAEAEAQTTPPPTSPKTKPSKKRRRTPTPTPTPALQFESSQKPETSIPVSKNNKKNKDHRISSLRPPSKDLLKNPTPPTKTPNIVAKEPIKRNKFKKSLFKDYVENVDNVYSKLVPQVSNKIPVKARRDRDSKKKI